MRPSQLVRMGLCKTTWRRPPTIAKLSEQLDLGLFHNEPWEGRSPRGLTRGHMGLIFKPQGAEHERFFDPEQLELWPIRRSTGRKNAELSFEAPSAPTLLPLPAVRN